MNVLKLYLIPAYILIFSFSAAPKKGEVYLFSYFKGNGEDGLHLAYSTDGMKWKALNSDKSFLAPVAGKDKLMRDPCIILGSDKVFRMVWTVSWNEKGIGYASSPDLIQWSEQRYIPVMEHEPGARNCWAPEVFYDKPTKQYIIFWSTTITGRFPETETTGDSGYNHRMYFVTTNDFVSFSKTQLFYDQGFNVIDGTLAKRMNEYLLFLKDETRNPPQKNIRLARSKNLASGYGKPSMPLTGNYWAEGPTVLKKGNEWIVYFDKYRDHTMGAVKSTDLVHWEDISALINFPEGTRHGTVFTVPAKLLKKLLKK